MTYQESLARIVALRRQAEGGALPKLPKAPDADTVEPGSDEERELLRRCDLRAEFLSLAPRVKAERAAATATEPSTVMEKAGGPDVQPSRSIG